MTRESQVDKIFAGGDYPSWDTPAATAVGPCYIKEDASWTLCACVI